nr:hypothetical protein [Tanacetum cinerariifolium]
DSIDYPTSEEDNDGDDDGDDLLEDDANNKDEEESSDIPSSIPSSSGSESILEADIPLQKRARFTTPTSRYEIGESSVAAA